MYGELQIDLSSDYGDNDIQDIQAKRQKKENPNKKDDVGGNNLIFADNQVAQMNAAEHNDAGDQNEAPILGSSLFDANGNIIDS